MSTNNRYLTALLFLLFLISGRANAQQKPTDAERLAWWHEAKFGLFINWGVHSLYGGEYKGHQQARGGAEWIMNRCKIPVAEYKDMAKQFNPVNYHPEAWVKMAKDAGMKYLVICMKHHDGFALFDSKASDWNVVKATPYGKDLLKPLAEACKKNGIKLGIYYSQAVDWINPGGSAARRLMKEGWPNPDSAKIDRYTKEHDGHWDPAQLTATFDEYIDKVAVPQVKELLTNYGEISILWWDYDAQMKSLDGALKLKNILALQPNIITNDRLHPDLHGDTKTPEQAIPERDAVAGQNWETCMTMNNSWGYRKSDNNWKSSETLIRNLIRITSRGGNYLLNVGPKPDGSFPEESIQRLADIGKWMKINGEAIYGTQAGRLPVLSWGECTQKEVKDKTILYLSVFEWPKNGQLEVPGLSNAILSARLLANGTKLKTTQSNGNSFIQVPDKAPDTIASVIKIEIKGTLNSTSGVPKKKMQTGAID
jgi:alpha-L-fucosidase